MHSDNRAEHVRGRREDGSQARRNTTARSVRLGDRIDVESLIIDCTVRIFSLAITVHAGRIESLMSLTASMFFHPRLQRS